MIYLRAIVAGVGLMAAGPSFAEQFKIYGIWYEGCEATCEAFQKTIADSGIDAEVIVRDAQQDKSLIPGLLDEARRLPVDLITTYGTATTLATVGRLDEAPADGAITDISVVFMFVSDPFGSHIAASFDGSGRANITGTYNRVPEGVNLEAIKSIRPNFARLGVLYTTSEPNSVAKVEELRLLADAGGFELVALEIDPGNSETPDAALIPGRVKDLADAGVDFVYVGSSSYLSKNAEEFTAAAVDNGLPVLSPYEEMVRDNSALVSIAARASDVGRIGAEQALRILRDGAVPGDLPIARVTDFAYVFNMAVAKRLKIYPPLELLQIAETVE